MFDSLSAAVSIALASLTRLTVCALTSASSSSAINLTRAKFIDFPKCSCMIGKSLLILPLFLELVVFFIEKSEVFFTKLLISKDLYNT